MPFHLHSLLFRVLQEISNKSWTISSKMHTLPSMQTNWTERSPPFYIQLASHSPLCAVKLKRQDGMMFSIGGSRSIPACDIDICTADASVQCRLICNCFTIMAEWAIELEAASSVSWLAVRERRQPSLTHPNLKEHAEFITVWFLIFVLTSFTSVWDLSYCEGRASHNVRVYNSDPWGLWF